MGQSILFDLIRKQGKDIKYNHADCGMMIFDQKTQDTHAGGSAVSYTHRAARNLLGLMYFGQGEVGEALVEWIISKNMKSHENIADYYIKKVQETPSGLETMKQAIRCV